MNNDLCDKIGELFEAVRERPAMYTGKSYDYAWMIQLITGFRLAIEVTGQFYLNFEDLKKAYAKRGWSQAISGQWRR